jgi:hypothetical protein
MTEKYGSKTGHMMYIHPSSLAALERDLAEFIQAALGRE